MGVRKKYLGYILLAILNLQLITAGFYDELNYNSNNSSDKKANSATLDSKNPIFLYDFDGILTTENYAILHHYSTLRCYEITNPKKPILTTIYLEDYLDEEMIYDSLNFKVLNISHNILTSVTSNNTHLFLYQFNISSLSNITVHNYQSINLNTTYIREYYQLTKDNELYFTAYYNQSNPGDYLYKLTIDEDNNLSFNNRWLLTFTPDSWIVNSIVNDQMFYLTTEKSLILSDLSKANETTTISFYNYSNFEVTIYFKSMQIENGLLTIKSYRNNGLRLFDISNPQNISKIDDELLSEEFNSLYINGSTLIMTSMDSMRICSITENNKLTKISDLKFRYKPDREFVRFTIKDNYLFMAKHSILEDVFYIVDISDLAKPNLIYPKGIILLDNSNLLILYTVLMWSTLIIVGGFLLIGLPIIIIKKRRKRKNSLS